MQDEQCFLSMTLWKKSKYRVFRIEIDIIEKYAL